MKKTPILVLLLVLMLFSCKKEKVEVAETTRLVNLPYGSDARNKMDVYLPYGRTATTSFILLLHGGAWMEGNKEDMHSVQEALLSRGIASASMNYRYASATVHYNGLMEDVDAAMDFCLAQSEGWKIRRDHYLIGGASAGAHMALLYAYGYDSNNVISGVVSAAGPTDFSESTWTDYAALIGLRPALENMSGATYVQPLDSNYYAASPIFQIRQIPTLMIHGNADLVVFYSQSERLSAALNAQGILHKLVTISNANHDMNLGDQATFNKVMSEISAWVVTYGK